jgi:hypothetical protein
VLGQITRLRARPGLSKAAKSAEIHRAENSGVVMKRYLPGRVETSLFAVLAMICAAVAVSVSATDAALSMLSFPIFVFAAVLGLWKSGRLRA